MNNNNQGSETDRDADINNEVNPHAPIRSVLPSLSSLTVGRDERPDLNLPFEENSNTIPNNESNIGALELNVSSSSSLTESNPQRIPDSLSRSSILQHQGSIHSIAESNIHSFAEVVGNNHDNNLDLSLSLYPIGSQQVEGMDGIVSANTRVLPSKRRYYDIDGAEFSIGESSRRRGPQLGIADQQLVANYSSQANSSNYLTNQLANVLQSSDIEVVIGEGSFPNMQNQGQAVPTSRAGILGMAQQLAAPSHANNSNNNLNLPSYNSTELANVHRSSEVDAGIGNQGLVPNIPNQSHAAIAPRARRAPRYIHATRMPNRYSRGLVATAFSHHDQACYLNQSAHSPSATSMPPLRYTPVLLPVHYGPRNEATAPLYNSRNIHGHLIPNPQHVSGNRAIARYASGTTLYYGNLPPIHYEQQGSSSNNNANPSNAPPEHDHMQQHGSAENENHSDATEIDLSAVVANSRNVNSQNSSAAARSRTRAPSHDGYVHRPIPIFASMLFPSNPELRARIMNQQVVQILRTARATNQDVNLGPTEEEILNRIKRENFELVGEETSESEEKCVVCQGEFVNGEEVGRLDICVHRFHVNCIKQWLLISNLCPICKQTALAIDVDDHE